MARFTVTGDKKLDRKLKKLGSKDSLKIVRSALREEQKGMQKLVKSTIPVGETKESKKGVKVRAAKRSRSSIGINTEVASKDPNDFHAQFAEYGTKNQPPQGTVRRAWDKKKNTAKKNLLNKIWNGIENAARK